MRIPQVRETESCNGWTAENVGKSDKIIQAG